MHPIKKLLDNIWNEGHTPLLLLDSRHEDVVMPAYIKVQFGERLPIKLKAADPLNIAFDETGIHADLAFQGHVMRCTMPWKRIYVVADDDTRVGVTITAHAPAATDRKEVEAVVKAETKKAAFTVIKGGKSN
jgi:hypothetical protein